jgi:hypothetical protein
VRTVSTPLAALHHFHAGDTYNPVEPASVLPRLQTLGFDKITVMLDRTLKFAARKPDEPAAWDAGSGPGDGGTESGRGLSAADPGTGAAA